MIQFNSLKHHLGHVQEVVQACREGRAEVLEVIKPIGHSAMDFYCGSLTLEEVKQEVRDFLFVHDLCERTLFGEFVYENGGHYIHTFADSSQWVLFLSDVEDSYVHLHPARFSPLVERAKAGALKTAIVMAVDGVKDFDTITIRKLNHYRSLIDLSPVSSVDKVPQIARLHSLIANS